MLTVQTIAIYFSTLFVPVCKCPGEKGECSGKRGVGLFNADENAVVVCMAVLAV
jgi:hypothetical protein